MPVDELRIVYRDPATLVAYEHNSRTHTDAQIDLISNAIGRWGFTNPVLLRDDDKTIGAGHARTRAAIKAGLDLVPTITLHGLTEEEWRAYVIADNQLAVTGSGWDMGLLKIEVQALAGLDFDTELLGFSDRMLSGLLETQTEGLTDPDEVPPTPELPVVQLGDVWLLGRHRLVCGDSTTVEAVTAALGGVSPDLMVTDPPYGVKHNQDARKNARLSAKDGAERATGTVMNDDRADWTEAWALFPGSVAYVWHAALTRFEVEKSLRDADFEVRAEVIWKKARPTMRAGNISDHSMGYCWQHENCLYVVKKGNKVKWMGDASQSTVWDIEHLKSETGHGTQKPVEAMLKPMQNNSSPGQAVYDPFVGSGTTIIAAAMANRTCHAIELDPRYAEVALLRWQAFSGLTATLEETGQTFAQVLAERQPGKALVNAAEKAPKRGKTK